MVDFLNVLCFNYRKTSEAAADLAACLPSDSYSLSLVNLSQVSGGSLPAGVFAALARLTSSGPAVLLLDIDRLSGRELAMLDWLHNFHTRFPVIVLNSSRSVEQATQAFKHGAVDYLLRGKKTASLLPSVLQQAAQNWSVQPNDALQSDLNQILLALTSELSVDQLLEKILIHLQFMVPYDSAAVLLVEEGGLLVQAGHGFPQPEKVVGQYFPLQDPLFQEVATTGKFLILQDAQQDPRFYARGETGYVRGWMMVPMIARGKVIGALSIDHREPSAYHEEHAALAQVMAAQAAIAIQNARLYDALQQELAERKITEQKLLARQLELTGLLNNIPGYVFVKDIHGRYELVNQRTAANQNLTPQEMIGKTDFDLISPSAAEKYHEYDQQVIRSRQPISYDELVTGENGELRTITTLKTPYFDETDQVIGVIGLTTDITDYIHIEQALRSSEEKFRQIFDLSPLGIVLIALEGNLVDLNPSALALFDLTRPKDMIGTSFKQWLVDEEYQRMQEDIETLWSKNTALHAKEYLAYHKDRSTFICSISICLTRDNLGQPNGYLAMVEDVTQRKKAEHTLLETQAQLRTRLAELEDYSREIALLTEMANMLQLSVSAEETYTIVAQYAGQLFPTLNGQLLVIDNSESVLETMAVWGKETATGEKFNPPDCWAVRRGRPYVVNTNNHTVCQHVHEPETVTSALCLPMNLQGRYSGVLHLHARNNETPISQAQQRLAAAVAEQVGLAIANLTLRNHLVHQAMHDPLTGLFNRHYLEEVLPREQSQAERSGEPIGTILLDLDHMKDLNSQYGHLVVDQMLGVVGKTLQDSVRAGDIACRFGGDEFLIVMPNANLDTSTQRAEQIRREVQKLVINIEGYRITGLTISIGVACWNPSIHRGIPIEKILNDADEALLQAKLNGRNQVVTGKNRI